MKLVPKDQVVFGKGVSTYGAVEDVVVGEQSVVHCGGEVVVEEAALVIGGEELVVGREEIVVE
jgi:hypothetical protein